MRILLLSIVLFLLILHINKIECFNGINNRIDNNINSNQHQQHLITSDKSIESDFDPIDFFNSKATTTHRLSTSIGQKLDNSPVLVLNADYTPLSFMPLSLLHWQDALRAVLNGKANVISEYDIVIKSPRIELKVPSVVALTKFQRSPESIATMNRRNVFIRDGYKCQYCYQEYPAKYLSLDHVIPRCKGGKLTWTNTVTACYSCNGKKGHTSIEDLAKIGMRLKSQPKTPTFYEIQFKAKMMKKLATNIHPHWTDYVL